MQDGDQEQQQRLDRSVRSAFLAVPTQLSGLVEDEDAAYRAGLCVCKEQLDGAVGARTEGQLDGPDPVR